MIFWIIVLAVIIFIGLYCIINAIRMKRSTTYFDWSDGLVASIWAIVIGAVAWGLALLISLGVVYEIGPDKQHKYDTQYLNALSLGNNVQGTFFLGTGSFDGSSAFVYVVKHDEGYSSIERVDASQAGIWEDEEKRPYVDISNYARTVWWVAPDFRWEWDLWLDRYDFHIPKNSITTGVYDIDITQQ